MRFRPALCAWILASVCPAAEDKPPEKIPPPRICLAIPPGVRPGTATRIRLRGTRLDKAVEIRFLAAEKTLFAIKPLEQGKAEVPAMQNAERVGDTYCIAEVTFPEDIPGASIELSAVSPEGPGAPHRLLLDGKAAFQEETEPNNEFRKPQGVAFPFAIAGKLERAQDVDVFQFEGKAGDQLAFDAAAGVFSSPADTLLAVYDANGRWIAGNDDSGGSTDASLRMTIHKPGRYFLCLLDAHDQGSAIHIYRLAGRRLAPRTPDTEKSR